MFNICICIHIWWSNFEIPFGLNRFYGELINFSGDNRSLAQSLLEAIDRPRTNDRFSATRHSEYLVFVQEAMVGFTLGPFPANWLVSIGLARSWPFPMIGFIDLASFGISSNGNRTKVKVISVCHYKSIYVLFTCLHLHLQRYLILTRCILVYRIEAFKIFL